MAGGLTGDDTKDIVSGALIGAAAGAGYATAARRTYGYLPDALARMNLALRYTFSATFDMGRYTEAGMIDILSAALPRLLEHDLRGAADDRAVWQLRL